MKKVTVLGVNFSDLSMDQFKNKLLNRLNNHLSTLIVTANPEIVMAANENPEFMKLINQDADYVSADGVGIIQGAKMLGTPLPERVTGYDLFTWLMHIANLRELRVYLIGAKPEVLAAVKEKVATQYPNINLVGAEDGYFKENLDVVANRIAKTHPDMVFAAIGYPRQEQLLHILRKDLVPAVMMGVGGSFDVFSGMTKRAPEAFQKLRLEWFYRLLKEPTRAKRMLVLPRYVMAVRKEKRKRKK